MGCERLVKRDEVKLNGFYAETFPRLTTEVENLGGLTRYVGFRSPHEAGTDLRFLGIEVGEFGLPAAGMTAWELRKRTLTRWSGPYRRHLVRRDPIEWTWLSESPSCPGRWLGEFMAGDSREHLVTAHAYVDTSVLGSGVDDVQIVEYDPSWPRQAADAAAWLRERLGPDLVLQVEHHGSTAIPGIPAKPILDLLVEVPSFGEARKRALSVFNDPVWEY